MKARISFAIMLATFLILGINIANNSYSQQQQEEEKQQIIIKDNIKTFDWYGLEYATDYVSTFTPPKAFDNKLITPQEKNVAWSQLGNSGFTVTLQNPLDKQICSAEIIPLNPKNSPFLLTVGNKSVEGKLDSTSIPVNFPVCAQNVDLIKFDIKSPNDKFNPIQEIKLFTSNKIPPIEPPVCGPNQYYDEKLKKCVDIQLPINGTTITNSTLNLKVSNSTITITTDASSKVIDQTNTTPIGTPLNENDDEGEDEEKDSDKEDSKN